MKGSKYWQLNDRDWLYQKYWMDELSSTEVASIIGCEPSSVLKALKKFNILIRSNSEAHRGEKNHRYGKSKYWQLLDKEWLYKKYWVEEEPSTEIAMIIGCDPVSVRNGLRRFGIPLRNNSEAHIGEKNQNYGKPRPEGAKKKVSDKLKGHIVSKETREIIRTINKKLWRDDEYIKKVIEGSKSKPNKLEKKVDNILQKLVPNEFKFNGDFSCGISVGGMIPDFVNTNGNKLVIEVFGNRWHEGEFVKDSWKRTEFGRIATYAQFGFECIILWGNDLKYNAERFILTKLKEFNVL